MPIGKLLALLVLVPLYQLHCFSQHIMEVGGSLSDNTVWDADTVKITDDVYVEAGVTLLVKEGVYIQS